MGGKKLSAKDIDEMRDYARRHPELSYDLVGKMFRVTGVTARNVILKLGAHKDTKTNDHSELLDYDKC